MAGVAALVSLFSFLYYFQPGRSPALWRRGRAHQYCAARVRFADSRPAATGNGVASPASSVDDPVYLVGCDVAERSRRFDSFDDRLRVRGAWAYFGSVRGLLEADLRAKAPPAAAVGAWIAALAYGANPNLIYMQATAMTRVGLPGAVHLGRRVLRGIYSRTCEAERNHAIQTTQSGMHRRTASLMRCALVSGRRGTHPLRRMVSGRRRRAAVVVIALRRWQTIADELARRAAAEISAGDCAGSSPVAGIQRSGVSGTRWSLRTVRIRRRRSSSAWPRRIRRSTMLGSRPSIS